MIYNVSIGPGPECTKYRDPWSALAEARALRALGYSVVIERVGCTTKRYSYDELNNELGRPLLQPFVY
jgi:hypothetical protein